jgi:oxygen-independent coproporphyrinogen-3 oxidase
MEVGQAFLAWALVGRADARPDLELHDGIAMALAEQEGQAVLQGVAMRGRGLQSGSSVPESVGHRPRSSRGRYAVDMSSVPAVSVPPAPFDDGRVGVYLHLPFCERICPYCDFAVVAARELSPAREAEYVDALCRELAARQADFAGRSLASLYFGGGTPALFRPKSIARLVDAVRAAFPGEQGAGGTNDLIESTIELNPSTVELARLPGFREAGIDRLSIGVQSFQDDRLKRLGRAHRAGVVYETLRAARDAGFENISLDLIFALPGESLAALDEDIDAVLAVLPEHVSTYELTFEPETPFGQALARGRMRACDEELAADSIEHIESRLGAAGYDRYEISSHARGGHRSRHNARYWQREAVLGLGMGAHSFEARTSSHPHGRRRANPRSLEDWLRGVERDPRCVGRVELYSAATARGEAVFLALRQREGLASARFEAEFGSPPRRFFESEIERAVEIGWLVEGDPLPGDLRLTPVGRLLADSVAALFVADQDGAEGDSAGSRGSR